LSWLCISGTASACHLSLIEKASQGWNKVAMQQSLAHIALVVDDYDDAIRWYCEKLDFRLVADEYQAEQDKRWVLIAPPGSGDAATTLLLARATNAKQRQFIGNQAGGRVFLFLKTDDFARDYAKMQARDVHFIREPKKEPYGQVAVFEDIYGNAWDLIQFVTTTP
jgi:catechol 2,3-dioxygenase-like lactoylglutathione lyase family enzyme